MTTDNREVVVYEGTVVLPVPVDEAVRQWEQYQELTRRLLNESDYQQIGKGRFKKKSAWRKYSRAFNLNDEVQSEHVERAPDGWPVWARVVIRAIAPNGRHAEADGECHMAERCCPASYGSECGKSDYSNHDCCEPGCNPRIHWSHPGDIAETALTRAKNRAVSDLIGAGEVSAEEMEGQREPRQATGRRQPAQKAPEMPSEEDKNAYGRGMMQAMALGIDLVPFEVGPEINRADLVAKSKELATAIKRATERKGTEEATVNQGEDQGREAEVAAGQQEMPG